MDDQERYTRLVSALGFRSRLDEVPDGPAVDLLDLDGDPMDPPVRLHIDPRTLGEHLRLDEQRRVPADPEDGPDPDDDPAVAALQLLIGQIEAAVLERETGQDHLVLTDGGVRSVSADQVTTV